MEKKEIERLFKKFDDDEDGYIDRKQFRRAMHELRVPYSDKSVDKFLESVGLDPAKETKFSWTQFYSFVISQQDALKRSFHELDITRDGALGEKDIKTMCKKLKIDLSEEQIRHMISIIDADGSGAVEFGEFANTFFGIGNLDPEDIFDEWLSHANLELGDYAGAMELPDASDSSSAVLLVSGAIAGAISRTVTAPMDRLRTLMQAQVQSPKLSPKYNTQQYVAILPSIKKIYADSGIRGFWRGNGANVIKIAPETAIRFWTYENSKALFCADLDHITVAERFLAGSFSGAAAQLVIYPLEIAKTRIALSSYQEYSGIFHCLISCVQREGWRSIYKGLNASLLGIVPYAGVDLTVFNTLKDWYEKRYHGEKPGIATLLACGAVATTCGQLVTYPIQLVRTRLQAQGMKGRDKVIYKGITDCLKQTARNEGIRGLYKGILPNFMKTLPAISISYAVYETTKNFLTTWDANRRR